MLPHEASRKAAQGPWDDQQCIRSRALGRMAVSALLIDAMAAYSQRKEQSRYPFAPGSKRDDTFSASKPRE